MSQWVVRLPDRLIRLQRPVQEIRVFSTDEVLQFKTYYGSGETKSRIEQQHDSNERRADIKFEYWILLVPLDTPPDLPLEVLCCTVHRETADRILDSLWLSLFTNCGDNSYVDLRELLAADLITPEQVATTPTAGRFVDLGDGAPRRPTVATGSVATAAIPVQTVPTNRRHAEGSWREEVESRPAPDPNPNPLWLRRVLGGSEGHARSAVFDAADYSGIETRASAAAMYNDPVERVIGPPQRIDAVTEQRGAPQQSSPPGFSPQDVQARSRAELSQALRQGTVPNIGRGMDRNADALSPRERDRLQVQLQAALMRQQAENRNTHAVMLPHGVDYSGYLQPQTIAVPPVPPDNDAVDRVDPDF